MTGLNTFFDMGGYAAFVWPAYALALVILGGLIVHAVVALRAAEKRLAEQPETPARAARRVRATQSAEPPNPETVA